MATAISDSGNVYGVIARNDIKGEYTFVGEFNREYLDQLLKIIREINPLDTVELGYVMADGGGSAMLCLSFKDFTGFFALAGIRKEG
jgi:hypothetical protein